MKLGIERDCGSLCMIRNTQLHVAVPDILGRIFSSIAAGCAVSLCNCLSRKPSRAVSLRPLGFPFSEFNYASVVALSLGGQRFTAKKCSCVHYQEVFEFSNFLSKIRAFCDRSGRTPNGFRYATCDSCHPALKPIWGAGLIEATHLPRSPFFFSRRICVDPRKPHCCFQSSDILVSNCRSTHLFLIQTNVFNSKSYPCRSTRIFSPQKHLSMPCVMVTRTPGSG